MTKCLFLQTSVFFSGLLFLLVLQISCSAQKEKTSDSSAFSVPTIHMAIADSEKRMDYMLTQYLDNLNFNDTTWINAYDVSEELEVDNKLYAIRAIPSFYLLDASKKAHLHDGAVDQVIGGFR
ncbi:MAG: DUF5106 domain-containing protein [Mangrovibacterium sp.]